MFINSKLHSSFHQYAWKAFLRDVGDHTPPRSFHYLAFLRCLFQQIKHGIWRTGRSAIKCNGQAISRFHNLAQRKVFPGPQTLFISLIFITVLKLSHLSPFINYRAFYLFTQSDLFANHVDPPVETAFCTWS